jgi:hypothetical protein
LIGGIRTCIFIFYVYGFWIGTTFVKKGIKNESTGNPYTTGEFLTVFTAIMIGMVNVIGLTPNLQAVIKAKVIGKTIFDVIDRVPEIKDNG